MKRRKGSVLATVLLLSLFLVIITAVVANNTLANFRTTNRASDTGTSRYVAYAGVQHALVLLKEDNKYNNSDTTPLKGNIPNHPELRYEVVVKNQRDKIPPAMAGGSESFRFNLTQIPENCARIESSVIATDGSKERVLNGMVGTAVWSPSTFNKAATGRQLIVMQDDARTMAFDFSQYDGWERDKNDPDLDPNSGYMKPNTSSGDDDDDEDDDPTKGSADIQSESLLHFAGKAKVEGDVTRRLSDDDPVPGEEGPVIPSGRAELMEMLQNAAPALAQALPSKPSPGKQGTNFTGRELPLSSLSEAPPAEAPYPRSEATAVLNDFPGVVRMGGDGKPQKDMSGNVIRDPEVLTPKAYKSVRVPAGQTLLLQPGRYYISDEFKVDGKIEVTGGSMDDIVVYVGKQMVVNGQVNFEGSPAKLQVYFTDEDAPAGQLDADGLPVDKNGKPTRGYSRLTMNPSSKATMVVDGLNLISTLDNARLLGALSSGAIWLKGKSRIEYDTNLKGRQMAGSSPWKLEGVYETVLK